MNIIFTGAQGTGKSTVLNRFKEKGYDTITEVVRNLSKRGIKINEQGNTESQKMIFNEYIKLFEQNPNAVSDRGLTDVLAYTKYLYDNGQIDSDEYLREQAVLTKSLRFNDLYIYFPIEFPVVDDGVRSTDESFRKAIDKNILDILIKFNIPYVRVTGTVDERVEVITNAIMLQ